MLATSSAPELRPIAEASRRMPHGDITSSAYRFGLTFGKDSELSSQKRGFGRRVNARPSEPEGETFKDDKWRFRWADMISSANNIHFRPEITKTGEGRISPLIEPAHSELLALKERGVCEPSIFDISVHYATHLLRELLGELGLKETRTGAIA